MNVRIAMGRVLVGWCCMVVCCAVPAHPLPVPVPVLVLDVSPAADSQYNNLAAEGIERWKQETGKKARLERVRSSKQRDEVLRRLADQGADPIIVLGYTQADVLSEVAADFPKTRFVIVDDVVVMPNVQSVVFKEQEGSFLAGALAAMVSQTKKLGFVGGMDIPLQRRYQCAYEQGAKFTNTSIQVFGSLVGLSAQAWSNPKRAGELGSAQIAQGADVIYTPAAASSIGVFNVAQQAHVWAIAADSNQNALKPGTVFASMRKRVDVAVQQALNRFEPGTTELGLQEGALDFVYDAQNTALLTQDTKARLDVVAQDIVRGKILVADYLEKNRCDY